MAKKQRIYLDGDKESITNLWEAFDWAELLEMEAIHGDLSEYWFSEREKSLEYANRRLMEKAGFKYHPDSVHSSIYFRVKDCIDGHYTPDPATRPIVFQGRLPRIAYEYIDAICCLCIDHRNNLQAFVQAIEQIFGKPSVREDDIRNPKVRGEVHDFFRPGGKVANITQQAESKSDILDGYDLGERFFLEEKRKKTNRGIFKYLIQREHKSVSGFKDTNKDFQTWEKRLSRARRIGGIGGIGNPVRIDTKKRFDDLKTMSSRFDKGDNSGQS